MSEPPNRQILLGAQYLASKTPTGLERYYRELLPRLASQVSDKQLAIFSLDRREDFTPCLPENIRAFPLSIPRNRFYLQAFFGGQPPIERRLGGGELLHLLVPMAVSTRLPLAVTIHDLTPLITPQAFSWYGPFVFRAVLRRLAKQGAYFITNSHYTKTDLISYFAIAPERVFPVYMGIDPKFKPQLDAESQARVRAKYQLGDRYFLFLGAMNRRKNLTTLLAAFREFLASGDTSTKLVLAGRMNWGGDELRQSVAEQRLEEVVRLPGYIEDEDLAAVIGGAIALVYPSLYEGFGFPPLEAMACGTPAIVSNVSSLPETTGGKAILVEPQDASGFAKAMHLLSRDRDYRAHLGREGLKWVEQFSWEETARQTSQVYERVMLARSPV